MTHNVLENGIGVELVRTDPRQGVTEPRGAGNAWARWRERLWPLEGGRGAIPALDGLRALAALSVVVYHATATAGARTVIGGDNLTWAYFYTESGVDLFFVLSGFLLFLPYARAILDGRSGPRALAFYRRRALRILPAYYVCLGVVALSQTLMGAGPSPSNVSAHLFFLHDIWPAFNRTISGPFWTLAVEWQFYLILPWVAWLIARFSAGKNGKTRLALATVGVIAVALAVREAAALVESRWTALPRGWSPWVDWALRILIGSQGKYLEVFGVGMLCAVAYLIAVERAPHHASNSSQPFSEESGLLRRFAPYGWRWWAGLALLGLALTSYLALAPLVYERRNAILAAWYGALNPTDIQMILGPLALGIGYGALLLGILLGPGVIRAIFSWPALRFVGLISYSLYLWHETVINTAYPLLRLPAQPGPLNGLAALAIGFGVAIPFAYLSYQLIERPFLKMR
jgi:peptidoglycan/LPS O-acetylase OafA/YrhL